MYLAEWDILSLCIYLILGLLPCWALNSNKLTIRIDKKIKISLSILSWYIIWLFFAVFRFVDVGRGGSDAVTYISYFSICLDNDSNHIYARHNDFLYVILNKGLRIFTTNYHWLFFVVYSIMILSYIQIIKKLCIKKYISYIPISILIYIYIRGFTSIRTNLSVSLVLLSIVCCSRKKYKSSILLAFSSVFMQKASIFYAFYLAIYMLYKEKKLTLSKCIIFMILSSIAGVISQWVILHTNISFLESGAYVYYAGISLEKSFFDSFWKIAFPQLLLLAALIILNKKLLVFENKMDIDSREKFRFVRLLCYYDIMLIPVTYILNLWRGYEYLYIIRLIMWGYIITCCSADLSKNTRKIFKLVCLLLFLSWMAFRLYKTYEDSALMPYTLEFFPK